MPVVIPPSARHTISRQEDTLEIIIPVDKNWLLIISLSISLILWVSAEVVTLGALIFMFDPSLPERINQPSIGGSLITLIIWTIGGCLGLYVLLWQLIGKEKITVNHGGLTIRREIFGFSRPKEYLANHITGLRVSTDRHNLPDWVRLLNLWGIESGILAFDYGAKTFRFGNGIGEAEAKQIFNEIQLHFPKYLKEI
ncbi:MAG: hypothetical protein H6658_05700 [Ardenticatenaceae bacterium]|nr:hypothetical protein [Ardenticatenaceae bacterium]